MIKPKSAFAPAAKPSLRFAPVIAIRQNDSVFDNDARECIGMLESLLKQARRGELIGLALISTYKDDMFDLGAAGKLNSTPIFTLGLIDILREEMLKKVEA